MERKIRNSTFPPSFCKSYMKEIPWDIPWDFQDMKNRSGSARLLLPGIWPPKKGSLYPTASQTAYKQGSLSLQALQVVRCTRAALASVTSVGSSTGFLGYKSVIPAGKPTSTCTVTDLWCYRQQCPLLFAEGPWTKTGCETKYSLLILCKEAGSICGLLFCQNATKNNTHRRCYLNSNFSFLFRSLRE